MMWQGLKYPTPNAFTNIELMSNSVKSQCYKQGSKSQNTWKTHNRHDTKRKINLIEIVIMPPQEEKKATKLIVLT